MSTAITELCQEVRNWFPELDAYGDAVAYLGTYTVEDGAIALPFLQEGQYYRIIDSVFNDGVHQYRKEAAGELEDEIFKGTICPMHIPKSVINLAAEIAAWRHKYEDPDSPAMSPYTSETLFDYSYSKNAPGNSAGAGSSAASWVSVFKDRLRPWRKIL